MEFTTENLRITLATRADLVTALRNSKRVWHQASVNVCIKTSSFQTALRDFTLTTCEEMAPFFKRCVTAVRTVSKADKDLDGNVIESECYTTDYKLQLQLTSVAKPP